VLRWDNATPAAQAAIAVKVDVWTTSFYTVNNAALKGVLAWDASTVQFSQPVTMADDCGVCVTRWQDLALQGTVQNIWEFLAEPEPEGYDMNVRRCPHVQCVAAAGSLMILYEHASRLQETSPRICVQVDEDAVFWAVGNLQQR
jgi:hypothetical protein